MTYFNRERIILSFILNLTQVNMNKHLREFRQWAKEFSSDCAAIALMLCKPGFDVEIGFRKSFPLISSPLTSQTTLAAAAAEYTELPLM